MCGKCLCGFVRLQWPCENLTLHNKWIGFFVGDIFVGLKHAFSPPVRWCNGRVGGDRKWNNQCELQGNRSTSINLNLRDASATVLSKKIWSILYGSYRKKPNILYLSHEYHHSSYLQLWELNIWPITIIFAFMCSKAHATLWIP